MPKTIYKVHNDYIEFIEYPFPCASVCKGKILKATAIIDVADRSLGPPVIRTVDNELIFTPTQTDEAGSQHENLPLFYANNNIHVRKATDIWDLILEPFLDTEHSEDFKAKTFARLKSCGISRKECECLRHEVSARMLSYNFSSGLWDWCYLGLYDVLCASIGFLSGEKFRLSDADFEAFYWRAMKIALKGFMCCNNELNE